MAAIGVSAFESALGGLSRGEFALFVAELWAARGYDTGVEDGGRVVVVRDGQPSRLGVHHDARRFARLHRLRSAPASRDVDAVVSSGVDPSGCGTVPTVDAGDLREMALYAVDRRDCEALFRRHLDRPPTATAEPGHRGLLAASAVGVVLVVALALFAGVGGVGVPATPDDTQRPAVGTATPSAGASGPPAGTDGDVAGTTTAVGGSPGKTYPPGIDRFGVVNATEAARGHTRAVRNRSYRWTTTYRIQRNGTTAAARRHTVRVHNATVYRSRVEWRSGLQAGNAVRGNASTYADGSVTLRRIREGGATWYERSPADGSPAPFVDRPGRLIGCYFTVERSWLVDLSGAGEPPTYWVIGAGDPRSNATGVTNTSVSARVTPRGVVRSLRISYRRDTGERIVIRFRLAGLGDTTVEPPPWVGRARAATAD